MSEESELKFCSACGALLEIKIPEGDTRERHVCTK
ncbi:zinc ribbon domain-containing protein, partial [Turicimonas muris]